LLLLLLLMLVLWFVGQYWGCGEEGVVTVEEA